MVLIIHSVTKNEPVGYLQSHIISGNQRSKLNRFFLAQYGNLYICRTRRPAMFGNRSEGNSPVKNIVHQQHIPPFHRKLWMTLPDKLAALHLPAIAGCVKIVYLQHKGQTRQQITQSRKCAIHYPENKRIFCGEISGDFLGYTVERLLDFYTCIQTLCLRKNLFKYLPGFVHSRSLMLSSSRLTLPEQPRIRFLCMFITLSRSNQFGAFDHVALVVWH